MKILMITTFYPQPGRTDLLRDTAAMHYIAREWVKQGHDVTVLHGYGHYFRELIRELGKHDFRKYTHVQRCPDHEGVRVLLTENQFWVRNAKWYFPRQQKKIAKAINTYFKEQMPDYQPDLLLVHFPTNYIGIVDRLDFSCKKAAVFHKTDHGTLCQHPEVIPRIINTYDALGARTAQMAGKLADLGVPTGFLAQSGIDEEMPVSRQTVEEKWRENPPVWKLIYAGNFNRGKHVDSVIRAAAALRSEFPLELTLIGDGATLDECRSLARELDLPCRFTGRLSREETVRHIAEAHVFAMVSSPETLGLVYLEAMSQGTLAIGSRGEGIDGIILSGQNGWLSPPGDPEALASCLKTLFGRTAAENRAMALAGLATVEDMTGAKAAAHYLRDALACAEGKSP